MLAIEGDSAFGFSGMEVETICRYNLPVCVVVFNNNGIYRGTDVNPAGGADPAHYRLRQGLALRQDDGGVRRRRRQCDHARRAEARRRTRPWTPASPTLINAVIDPAAGSESGRIGNLNPQSALEEAATQ